MPAQTNCGSKCGSYLYCCFVPVSLSVSGVTSPTGGLFMRFLSLWLYCSMFLFAAFFASSLFPLYFYFFSNQISSHLTLWGIVKQSIFQSNTHAPYAQNGKKTKFFPIPLNPYLTITYYTSVSSVKSVAIPILSGFSNQTRLSIPIIEVVL